MPYITKESLQAAKQMDLLTYLQLCDPQNLVHLSGDTYCTREHDSLKISNGKWHWFSRHIGGRSALDYLIKVKGFSLPMAVEQDLTDRQRQILRMRYSQSMTVSSIARELGINKSTVSRTLSNSTMKLYRSLRYSL